MLLEEATLRRNTNERNKETNVTTHAATCTAHITSQAASRAYALATCARGVPRILGSATTHAAAST